MTGGGSKIPVELADDASKGRPRKSVTFSANVLKDVVESKYAQDLQALLEPGGGRMVEEDDGANGDWSGEDTDADSDWEDVDRTAVEARIEAMQLAQKQRIPERTGALLDKAAATQEEVEERDTSQFSPIEIQYLKIYDTLLANQRLQSRLRDTLASIEAGICLNAERQAKIQVAAMGANRTGWYHGMKEVDFPTVGRVRPTAMGPSRFWLVGGAVPEPNTDTTQLLEAYQYLPQEFHVRKWTRAEDEAVAAGVLSAIQETKQEEAIDRALALEDGGEREGQANETPQAELEVIGALTMESSGMEAAGMALTYEQWEQVAKQRGIGGREAMEVKQRWVNYLRPSLKKGPKGDVEAPWTASEKAKLRELSDKHKQANWPAIAEELGTGRSAIACLQYFQREENRFFIGKPWSVEEKQKLRELHAKHTGRGAWTAIAAELQGRTANQVMHHWVNHMADTSHKKGKWDAAEDEALRQAVAVFGHRWHKVAEWVPGRNQLQVRERWVNSLDPSIKRHVKWTKEEDSTLVAALQSQEFKTAKGGYRWAQIAARIPGRTDDDCSNRARTIINDTKKKKAMEEKLKKKEEELKKKEEERAARVKANEEKLRKLNEERAAKGLPPKTSTWRPEKKKAPAAAPVRTSERKRKAPGPATGASKRQTRPRKSRTTRQPRKGESSDEAESSESSKSSDDEGMGERPWSGSESESESASEPEADNEGWSPADGGDGSAHKQARRRPPATKPSADGAAAGAAASDIMAGKGMRDPMAPQQPAELGLVADAEAEAAANGTQPRTRAASRVRAATGTPQGGANEGTQPQAPGRKRGYNKRPAAQDDAAAASQQEAAEVGPMPAEVS